MHLGHLASALAVWDTARAQGGRVLLRIEDIDATRCRPAHTADFIDNLTWLGLLPDGPVRVQSEHLSDYARALDTLSARGLLYRCFLTRSQIEADIARAPHGLPVYLGPSTPLSPAEESERLANGEPFSLRLSLARARDALGPLWHDLCWQEDGRTIPARPETLGDVILSRKDAPVAYHLACTHDDALQGVTHIIRGADLYESTHIHVLLQALMGWPTPAYRHHPLKTGPDGRRLAKRDGATALTTLRAQGWTASALREAAHLPRNL
jgi:glutamyl-Q tRNA(Asp) synthetase